MEQIERDRRLKAVVDGDELARKHELTRNYREQNTLLLQQKLREQQSPLLTPAKISLSSNKHAVAMLNKRFLDPEPAVGVRSSIII